MASENRLPAFDRPGLDSHGSLLCNWQVDDNSEGIRAVSVLGVAALELAPFAQPRTLLLVGKGYSVTGPLGGALFQVILVARAASAKKLVFARAGCQNSPRAN